MCSKNGTRIQEELGDTIKIYTSAEWAIELARRESDEKIRIEKEEKKEAKEITIKDEVLDVAPKKIVSKGVKATGKAKVKAKAETKAL